MTMRVLLTVLIVILVAAGCAYRPTPEVRDFDTYQDVTIGPVHYLTPNGVVATKTGSGFVLHEVERIPNTTVRVEVDLSPPRSLQLDADRELRQFLTEVPKGIQTSVQYLTLEDKEYNFRESNIERYQTEYVKAFVNGQDKNGMALRGVLVVIRHASDTAMVKVVGPKEEQQRLNDLAEEVAMNLRIQRSQS